MTDSRCDDACRDLVVPPDQVIREAGPCPTVLFRDQFFRGHCLVVLKEHRTELFHLTPAVRFVLMEEVSRLAEAVNRALGPDKINYELLGNRVPHLHWHVVPRYRSDPPVGTAHLGGAPRPRGASPRGPAGADRVDPPVPGIGSGALRCPAVTLAPPGPWR